MDCTIASSSSLCNSNFSVVTGAKMAWRPAWLSLSLFFTMQFIVNTLPASFHTDHCHNRLNPSRRQLSFFLCLFKVGKERRVRFYSNSYTHVYMCTHTEHVLKKAHTDLFVFKAQTAKVWSEGKKNKEQKQLELSPLVSIPHHTSYNFHSCPSRLITYVESNTEPVDMGQWQSPED